MKQLLRRFGVPFTMLIFCALLCVYIYRLPKAVREPLPVLMYHHLVEDGQDCNDMTVTPSKLRSDLETILALGYTPVLPRELAAGGPLPEKPILITFDDGYLSNYEYAWPILEKYGMVATIFMVGSTTGNTEHYKDTAYPITPHFSYEQGAEMVVEVADSGPGVSGELRATLFERPSVLEPGQSPESRGGLGLMIVRRMLQLHGGDIQLVDVPAGASFRFPLPLRS